MMQKTHFFLWPAVFFLSVHFLALLLASQLKEVLIHWPRLALWWFLAFYFAVTAALLFLFKIIRIPGFAPAYSAVLKPLRWLIRFCRIPPAVTSVFGKELLGKIASLKIWVHDLFILGLLIFMALDLGALFLPFNAVIIVGVIAVYDVLAVSVFKSMVGLVAALIRFYLIPGIIFPKRSFTDFNSSLEVVAQDFDISREVKLERFSLLGGGDIGIPAILAVSVFLFWGLSFALIVIGFSLLGLLLTYFFFIFLDHRPFPALSFIGIGSIAGLLFGFFLLT